ncbi:MAG: hypothetical protein WAK17_20645 [Candidatus Nitrosopolaris sp.]|jgi:hypothetical protein
MLESYVDFRNGSQCQQVLSHEDKGEWELADAGTVKSHCKRDGTPAITR